MCKTIFWILSMSLLTYPVMDPLQTGTAYSRIDLQCFVYISTSSSLFAPIFLSLFIFSIYLFIRAILILSIFAYEEWRYHLLNHPLITDPDPWVIISFLSIFSLANFFTRHPSHLVIVIAKLSSSRQLKFQLIWDSIITMCLPTPLADLTRNSSKM